MMDRLRKKDDPMEQKIGDLLWYKSEYGSLMEEYQKLEKELKKYKEADNSWIGVPEPISNYMVFRTDRSDSKASIYLSSQNDGQIQFKKANDDIIPLVHYFHKNGPWILEMNQTDAKQMNRERIYNAEPAMRKPQK